MINFSTDEFQPDDRFEHWREMRCRELMGVTIELERERRRDFHGQFSAAVVGGATLAELKASSYVVSRTERDIGRLSSGSLWIARQVRGPGWIGSGGNEALAVEESSLVIGHSDLAYVATPARQNGFHFRVLKVPLPAKDDLSRAADGLTPGPFTQRLPVLKLISCVFDAVVDQGTSLPDAERVIQGLAQLAMIARGRAGPGTPESRLALRGGYLIAARHLISRHSRDAKLTPEAVATALGMSVRKLHTLFEPTGQSFARTLMAVRVADAYRRLSAEPERPVTGIAFGAGFDSVATFYRAFRTAFESTPRDVRRFMLDE